MRKDKGDFLSPVMAGKKKNEAASLPLPCPALPRCNESARPVENEGVCSREEEKVKLGK